MVSVSKRKRQQRRKQPPRFRTNSLSALSRLRAAIASVVGRGHEKDGIVCQDAVAMVQGNRAVAIVVADGAGSASQAEFGSRAVADDLAAKLSNDFTALASLDHDALSATLFDAMTGAIAREARRLGCGHPDLATTVLFVVTDGKVLIGGQLGDGRVAIRDQQGVWRSWFEPVRGEFANQTVFVTSPQAHQSLQLERCPLAGVTGCILMTDGAEAGLFRKADGRFADAVETMASWLLRHPREDVEAALTENLRDVLRTKSRDDVSLGILMRS